MFHLHETLTVEDDYSTSSHHPKQDKEEAKIKEERMVPTSISKIFPSRFLVLSYWLDLGHVAPTPKEAKICVFLANCHHEQNNGCVLREKLRISLGKQLMACAIPSLVVSLHLPSPVWLSLPPSMALCNNVLKTV